MLEGLDRIPWKRLSTSYGLAKDAPHYIRLFLSSDKADREQAVEYIIGAVNHQGHIHDSTAAVTPFLIELLANPEVQDREQILSVLSAFASSVDKACGSINSVASLGTVAQLYNHLVSGIGIYESFLSHPDNDTRVDAVLLIADLHQNSARTRLRLWHTFKREPLAYIRAEILDALIKTLPHDWNPNKRLLIRYRNCFETLVNTDENPDVKCNAAIGWIQCEALRLQFNNIAIKPPEAIVQALLPALSYKGYVSKTMHYFLSLDKEIVQRIFSTADLTAPTLHVIARHLLSKTFRVTNRVGALSRGQGTYQKGWDFLLERDHQSGVLQSAMYQFKGNSYEQRHRADIHSDVPAGLEKRRLLQTILKRDRFWELPTNLFSFFFDLPDDREALQELVETSR